MGLILEKVAYPSEQSNINYMSLNTEGYIRYLQGDISAGAVEALKEDTFGKYECLCRDCGKTFLSYRKGAKRCEACWVDWYINTQIYQVHHIRIRNRIGRWEACWGVFRITDWHKGLLAHFHTKKEADLYAEVIRKNIKGQRIHFARLKDKD